jgi:glycerol-3-phosphate O-acyltransferase
MTDMNIALATGTRTSLRHPERASNLDMLNASANNQRHQTHTLAPCSSCRQEIYQRYPVVVRVLESMANGQSTVARRLERECTPVEQGKARLYRKAVPQGCAKPKSDKSTAPHALPPSTTPIA